MTEEEKLEITQNSLREGSKKAEERLEQHQKRKRKRYDVKIQHEAVLRWQKINSQYS